MGTLEDTAAERLLDQWGVAKKVYGNQVEPYVDLELGRIDAVLLDLPIAAYLARPNPKLKFVGPAIAPGYYAIAFRKEQEALAAAVRRRPGPPGPARGNCGGSTRNGTSGTSTRSNCSPANTVDDFLRESGRQWTFGRYFPLLLEGAAMTVSLTFLSMAAGHGPGAADRADAALRPGARCGWWPRSTSSFSAAFPCCCCLYFLYYGLPVIAETYGLPLSSETPAGRWRPFSASA